MAFRKFRDIEYPVPGTDTAIEVLRPGARYQLVGTHFTRGEDPERRVSRFKGSIRYVVS